MESLSQALSWPWMQALVNDHGWLWPVFEIIHYAGMSLIVGLIGALDLRILGLFRSVPIGAFKGFVPVAMVAFVANLAGGMVFVTGNATGAGFYVESLSFQLKILALVLAFANLLIFQFSGLERRVYAVPAGADAPRLAKVVALVSIVSWVGVIIFGRLLMYNDALLYTLGL
jgi:hypothetical protein